MQVPSSCRSSRRNHNRSDDRVSTNGRMGRHEGTTIDPTTESGKCEMIKGEAGNDQPNLIESATHEYHRRSLNLILFE